jgi:hypothetical protein
VKVFGVLLEEDFREGVEDTYTKRGGGRLVLLDMSDSQND